MVQVSSLCVPSAKNCGNVADHDTCDHDDNDDDDNDDDIDGDDVDDDEDDEKCVYASDIGHMWVFPRQ